MSVSFPSLLIFKHMLQSWTRHSLVVGVSVGVGRGMKINVFDAVSLSTLWRSFGVNGNSPPLSGALAVGVNLHFTDSCTFIVFLHGTIQAPALHYCIGNTLRGDHGRTQRPVKIKKGSTVRLPPCLHASLPPFLLLASLLSHTYLIILPIQIAFTTNLPTITALLQ